MRTHALVVQAKITVSMKEQNGKKMSVLTFALVSKGCGHLIFCSTHAAEKILFYFDLKHTGIDIFLIG